LRLDSNVKYPILGVPAHSDSFIFKAVYQLLKNPEPVVRLMEFADSGIALELRVWMTDPQEGVGNIKSDINLAIWRGFKEAGITIPFPQRDVNLRYMNLPVGADST
jgi:small-conductance mechanosensitive channel